MVGNKIKLRQVSTLIVLSFNVINARAVRQVNKIGCSSRKLHTKDQGLSNEKVILHIV